MTTQLDTEQQTLAEEWEDAWGFVLSGIRDLKIEDDEPLDNIASEKQKRLLTEPLYSSWNTLNHEQLFIAATNIGIFFQEHTKPVVPDMLLSLDVQVSPNIQEKQHRTYFMWAFGKAPEVVIEIISHRNDDELKRKQRIYAQIGCWYYIIFDPCCVLEGQILQVFSLQRPHYVLQTEQWLPEIGLGLTLWRGAYEGLEMEWLRWCYEDGTLIPTGAECAERAQARAERLAVQLRALGIDPQE